MELKGNYCFYNVMSIIRVLRINRIIRFMIIRFIRLHGLLRWKRKGAKAQNKVHINKVIAK